MRVTPRFSLMPTWTAVHSRMWKMQVPYLSRHTKVVTFDGRGNGRSDRPEGADAYRVEEFAADAIAVMDATKYLDCRHRRRVLWSALVVSAGG